MFGKIYVDNEANGDWSSLMSGAVKNTASGNLQSYLSTTSLRNLQSYLSSTRLRKLTVVFEYYEAKETYSRI